MMVSNSLPSALVEHPWLGPFVYIGLSQVLIILACALGAEKNLGIWRLTVAAVIPLCSCRVQALAWHITDNRIHQVFLTAFMWIQSLAAFDGLVLSKSSMETQTPFITRNHQDGSTKKIPGLSTNSLASWGFNMAINSRGIGTPWEVKKIPTWRSPAVDKNSKTQTPTKKRLTIYLIINAILSYLVVDLISLQPPPPPSLISPEKQNLFDRLPLMTTEEALTRFLLAIGCWVNAFFVLNFIGSAFYLLHMTITRLPVEMYPPIWGNLSAAWSIRQFWGSTWHQTLRRSLTSISSYIVHDILRLGRGSLVGRYLKIYISFWISGLIHFQSDMMAGIPVEESKAIWFFLACAKAIMFEDAVQYLTQRVLGEKSTAWRRWVGYVWVCGFMFYAVPPWLYPTMRYMRHGVDRPIPAAWSVAGFLFG